MLRSIEIKTTQNVTITYEHAYLRERILAFILDYIFLMVAVLTFYFIFFRSMVENETVAITVSMIGTLIVTFYTLVLESLNNGQTLGKLILRIKVVKMDGKQPDFYDYLLRWTLRLIDIWGSVGTLACILISSNPNSQRLGEIFSNTIVVRIRPRGQVTLNDILRIDDRQTYIPQFTEMRNFREDDILLIKQSIERFNKYKNAAHREVLIELCEVMKNRLHLEKLPENKMEFLKTCIKDYIVLTR